MANGNSPSVSTNYIYGIDGVLLAEGTGGTSIQEYVYLNGQLLAVISSGQVYYVHSDHLGTPLKLTNQSGNLVWSAVYDPYGKATVNEDPDGDGQKMVFNVRFPGQYYDAETGLHYNYFRYYDPQTGRYITSDPIGLQGGLNTYGYVGGNPVMNIDFYGLEICNMFGCRPEPNDVYGPHSGNIPPTIDELL